MAVLGQISTAEFTDLSAELGAPRAMFVHEQAFSTPIALAPVVRQ